MRFELRPAAGYTFSMATLTFDVSEEVKKLAETRAAAAGYASVAEYLAGLIEGEAAVRPSGLPWIQGNNLKACYPPGSMGRPRRWTRMTSAACARS